ncbi:hypothetical protein PsYK624_163280 [Phanerochaete sordida]|uniref:Uncharacterized protein n=1 Tax=Phanerochaete sordida TaxID=48140 RepID=A0A9P3GVK5_9APHY|nr:hypothetical protein PsYK624_163280 [Phanerochaete sordida]
MHMCTVCPRNHTSRTTNRATPRRCPAGVGVYCAAGFCGASAVQDSSPAELFIREHLTNRSPSVR